MVIKFFPNDKGNPAGKLADAEIHFDAGPLAGLKLLGFAIWERQNSGRNVTMPSRQYSVNGERRSFALLRPIADATSQDAIRSTILDAYRAFEDAQRDADGAAPTALGRFEVGPVDGGRRRATTSGQEVAALISARQTGAPVELTSGAKMQPDGRIIERDGFAWAADDATAREADRLTVHLRQAPPPFTLKGNDARPF